MPRSHTSLTDIDEAEDAWDLKFFSQDSIPGHIVSEPDTLQVHPALLQPLEVEVGHPGYNGANGDVPRVSGNSTAGEQPWSHLLHQWDPQFAIRHSSAQSTLQTFREYDREH